MQDDYIDPIDDYNYYDEDSYTNGSVNRLYLRIEDLQREIGILYDKVCMYGETETPNLEYSYAYIQEMYYMDKIKRLEQQLQLEREARFLNPRYYITENGEKWYIPEPEDFLMLKNIISQKTIIDNIVIVDDL